jgi:hypothetical protein
MVRSQMGWNDTSLAIENEMIVRAVAHYYASGRRGEMRRKDKPPRIGVGLEQFNPSAPRLIRMRAVIFCGALDTLFRLDDAPPLR